MRTDYFAKRASTGRIALAVLVTGGFALAGYLVAALLLMVLIAAAPTIALTGWFPWAIAFVQAVPLYAGAWLAGAFGTRVAASAPLRPGAVRVATVMALPCALTIALSLMSPGEAWFATALAIAATALGAWLGAIRRPA